MPLNIPPVTTDRSLNVWLMETYLSFSGMEGEIITVSDTGVGANTEFAVAHGLNKVPSHVELLVTEGQTDAYLNIKPSGTQWTGSNIYLKCDAANAAFKIKLW